MNRLMLCAGAGRRPGWQTLDSNPFHSPDFLNTIPPLPPAARRIHWDEIELIHGITSFYPWEAKRLLIDIREVLVPGGKLVLEQPDLDLVIRYIQYGSASAAWLFGDPQFDNPAHMNKWAYTTYSLEELLLASGFTRTIIQPVQHHNPTRDFRMEAYR